MSSAVSTQSPVVGETKYCNRFDPLGVTITPVTPIEDRTTFERNALFRQVPVAK